MRILFAMKHPSALRALAGVVRLLGERGHEVHLAFGGIKTSDSHAVLEQLADEQPGLTFGQRPGRARSSWTYLSGDLRRGADYLRYLEPVYANAPKLRARRKRGAPASVRLLGRAAQLAGPTVVTALRRALQSLDRCIDPPSDVHSFLADHRPDVVLVTHLVTGSGHGDLVRAAKRLGIHTGYLVFSWDNLTNKGLIREVPNVVLVWNELQAREAVELHGVPPEQVRATGAPSYDHWFSWLPSRSREEFCRVVGLRPDRPIVLYVCSSGFVAPDEVGFVRRWIAALRSHGGLLMDAGILVRPHPRNATQWASVDLEVPQVSVWPRLGQEPVDEETRQNYFDSIFYSDAVVGINTSAQIEGAIVGRPVHTVLADDFRDTQEGTLHFHYLRAEDFGHLHVARTLEEHTALLERSLRGGSSDDRNERFLRRFVRPLGPDVEATPLVVEAVEELAARPVPEPDHGPALAPLCRLGLRPLAAASVRQAKGRRVPVRERALGPGRMVRELARTQPGTPLVAGPWLDDEVGELLYWIPFLRWAQAANIGLRERLVVVARAQSAYWYAGIGSRRLALEELGSGDELAEIVACLREPQSDGALSERMAEALGVGSRSFRVLPPAVVAAARANLARRHAAMRLRDRRLEFEPLTAPELPPGLDLPDQFVAARFRFGPAFPDGEANRQLAAGIIAALSARGPLVVFDPPQPLREAFVVADGADLRFVPGAEYAAQSAVVARSGGFVGSYGATAYLAVLHGAPAMAVYTDPTRVDADDLRIASSFLAEPRYGRLQAMQAAGTAEEAAAQAVAFLEQPVRIPTLA